MPVNIHGRDYYTVAERLTQAGDKLHSVKTWIVGKEDDESLTMIAEIETDKGIFTGHARSYKSANSVEGEAPLEVAETSAVGRALAFAGYGSSESIASAEEVQDKNPPGRMHHTSPPKLTDEPQCPTHYKSKFGKGGYYCPTRVGGGWCDWRFKPEEEATWDDGAPTEDLDFE